MVRNFRRFEHDVDDEVSVSDDDGSRGKATASANRFLQFGSCRCICVSMILTTFCFVCFIFPLGWIYGYNAYGFGLPNKGSFADGIDVRVTKGFGTRPYNQIRISVVSTFPSPPIGDFFDFSSRFMYKWRDLFLHSAVKETTPGKSQTFDIGQDFKVRLPEVGSGVAGVLLADPCVNSPVRKNWLDCAYGDQFQTITSFPALINAFVGQDDMDFWGILGDNFYDRTGEITWDVFRRISTEVKSKIFMSVPGNHDYWVFGDPSAGTIADQCSHGHMQYYAQDTKASEFNQIFDFSVNPDDRVLGLGCNPPAIANSFWYNQVGNIGFVGQSGAYSLEASYPFMEEACAWLSNQPGLDLVILVGHWDLNDMGAADSMDMPNWYQRMAKLPGCHELSKRGTLKFLAGHTHCNDPHPANRVNADAGFRVAGFGMSGWGCSNPNPNYGIPVLDTTGGHARIWYFDTSSDESYQAVLSCVKQKGWRNCTPLASLWLDQPIGEAAAAITDKQIA